MDWQGKEGYDALGLQEAERRMDTPDTVRILVERVKVKVPMPRQSVADREWLRKSKKEETSEFQEEKARV